jgi:hypothetical protein
MEFVVEKAALGQVFSGYLDYPANSHSELIIAGIVGPLVEAVPSAFNLPSPHA